MKKKHPLMALFILVLFWGCDGNFGLQQIDTTYLVVNGTGDSEITLSCQSEKLRIPSLLVCNEVTDEVMLDWAKSNNLANDNSDFRMFRIPSRSVIDDSKNVSIYFKAEVDGKAYTGELNIPVLKNDHSSVKKEPVVLSMNAQTEKVLYSVFTYIFYRSI